MSSNARRSISRWVYGGSIVFHAALAVGAGLLPAEQKTESVAIELADIRKKNEKPKPPPPPPPPPPKEKPKPPPPPPPPKEQAKVAPTPAKEEAPPPEVGADGFADLGGVALGNAGAGGGGGGDGVPIGGPASPVAGAAAARAPKAVTHKVQELETTAGATQCSEPLVRPKHKTRVKPVYTMQARQAEIEGVVKVEVTVDESGRVLQARVLNGLGYGLDESALAAVKQWTFQPGSRCGRPLVATIVIPIRFEGT